MADVTFQVPEGELRAYLARPTGEGPWPGVIVIHDIFGMTAVLRSQCDWLAGAGFLSLGPDFFSWGRKLTCVRSFMNDLRLRSGRTFDDIDAARRWLVGNAENNCTGQIGVIGYCIGGGFSLLLAPDDHYSASSVNYGDVPEDAEKVLVHACPVVASYGAKDRRLKGEASRLETALTANAVPHDVKEYPDAGHGFLDRHDGKLGAFLAVIGRPVGVGYHESSAADARRRIIGFFDRYLKST